MAYHRPLDAYEQYIARKHEREALTQEITLEIPAHRPPWLASRLALDEADLTWAQWIYRIVMGIISLPIVIGIVMFIPPKRVNVLRKDLYDEMRQPMGAAAGSGTHVRLDPVVTAQPLQSS